MPNLKKLSSLKPGQKGTIQAIHSDTGFHFRLNALGFRIGKPLEVIRTGPFKGPIHLRLGNTDVMLRQFDANMIEVIV